jgi:hypothetical protein
VQISQVDPTSIHIESEVLPQSFHVPAGGKYPPVDYSVLKFKVSASFLRTSLQKYETVQYLPILDQGTVEIEKRYFNPPLPAWLQSQVGAHSGSVRILGYKIVPGIAESSYETTRTPIEADGSMSLVERLRVAIRGKLILPDVVDQQGFDWQSFQRQFPSTVSINDRPPTPVGTNGPHLNTSMLFENRGNGPRKNLPALLTEKQPDRGSNAVLEGPAFYQITRDLFGAQFDGFFSTVTGPQK